MIGLLLHMLRLVPFILGDHCHLALENLALRQQRLFWIGLARIWTRWRGALVIVIPEVGGLHHRYVRRAA